MGTPGRSRGGEGSLWAGACVVLSVGRCQQGRVSGAGPASLSFCGLWAWGGARRGPGPAVTRVGGRWLECASPGKEVVAGWALG